MSRAEVAAFLREFVEELEGDGETVATGVEQGDRRSEETGRRTDTGTAGQSGTGTSTGTGTGTSTGTGGGPGSEAERRRRTGDERAEPAAGDARRVTFVVGGDSATVTIPEAVEFDVEVESRSPLLQSGKSQAVEFQLSWEVEERQEDDSIDLK